MDHPQFLIERFDHYYDSVNNKGNVFLGVNIFLITGLVACLTALPDFITDLKWSIVWISSMLAVNLASLVFTLLALIPYIKNNGNSLIFFGSIARHPKNVFLQQFGQQSESSIKTDLAGQVYDLASGLRKKFHHLRLAGWLFFVEAALVIPLIITVIKNLK